MAIWHYSTMIDDWTGDADGRLSLRRKAVLSMTPAGRCRADGMPTGS